MVVHGFRNSVDTDEIFGKIADNVFNLVSQVVENAKNSEAKFGKHHCCKELDNVECILYIMSSITDETEITDFDELKTIFDDAYFFSRYAVKLKNCIDGMDFIDDDYFGDYIQTTWYPKWMECEDWRFNLKDCFVDELAEMVELMRW